MRHVVTLEALSKTGICHFKRRYATPFLAKPVRGLKSPAKLIASLCEARLHDQNQQVSLPFYKFAQADSDGNSALVANFAGSKIAASSFSFNAAALTLNSS